MDQKHTYPFQRALGKVLRGRQFTALELADEAGCSERHVRRVANGKVRASAEMAGLISRYLCRHDETRCTDAFACSGYRARPTRAGEADGEVDTDLAGLLEAAGDVRAAWRGKDGEAMDAALDRLLQEALDLRAERRTHLPTD
jgi:transcriptional regulator with XRE-family HTH domain